MIPHAQAGRIAFLGNYIPRSCGIATFTHHLWTAVEDRRRGCGSFVVAVNDRDEGYDYPAEVKLAIQQRDLDGYVAAAHALNRSGADVLSVQHEFGIYGGKAGGHLEALLREVRLPVVTTLHTVLQTPDEMQRKVMNTLVRRSERLVVMARKGLEILRDVYGAAESMIEVVPHGIPDLPCEAPPGIRKNLGLEGRKVLMTLGLLGPGKGVEYAIQAMPQIAACHPDAMYLILGATHPHLIAREGEKYRTRLEHLVADLGMTNHVAFHNLFVSDGDLRDFIMASDIYVTPYLNEAQITSGALAHVFGAGKAVISTPYWHAAELLANNRGVLVPFRDPEAISRAAIRLLDDPAAMSAMGRAAHAHARADIWPEVGLRYLEVFSRALTSGRVAPVPLVSPSSHVVRPGKLPRIRLEHVTRLTDGTGILQHAIYNVPNYHEGYCTDDNARALILCNLLEEAAVPFRREERDALATRYLAFLAAALDRESGRFRNFMGYDRRWTESQGSEDSHGRAMWALGHGSRHSADENHRLLCSELFERGTRAVRDFTSPRAWAFALLGARDHLEAHPGHPETMAARDAWHAKLRQRWQDASRDDWAWFEDHLTYENARICQAMILAGPGQAADFETGLHALRWLCEIQRSETGHFRPVGTDGYSRKEKNCRTHFDQQPVEAQATIAACLEAFAATADPFWWREARRAFDWFLGRNDLGAILADPASGACMDGLHPDRVNRNQGAESTLAFQISLAEMIAAEHRQHHDPPHPHDTAELLPA